MAIFKIIGKILAVPVWIVLFSCWLIIHIAVSISSLFCGICKLIFGAFALVAIIMHMWQNSVVFAGVILLLFLVLFAGVIIEALLQTSYKSVGQYIVTGR